MTPRIKKNNSLENRQAIWWSSYLNTAAAGRLKFRSTSAAEHSLGGSLPAVEKKGMVLSMMLTAEHPQPCPSSGNLTLRGCRSSQPSPEIRSPCTGDQKWVWKCQPSSTLSFWTGVQRGLLWWELTFAKDLGGEMQNINSWDNIAYIKLLTAKKKCIAWFINEPRE